MISLLSRFHYMAQTSLSVISNLAIFLSLSDSLCHRWIWYFTLSWTNLLPLWCSYTNSSGVRSTCMVLSLSFRILQKVYGPSSVTQLGFKP